MWYVMNPPKKRLTMRLRIRKLILKIYIKNATITPVPDVYNTKKYKGDI